MRTFAINGLYVNKYFVWAIVFKPYTPLVIWNFNFIFYKISQTKVKGCRAVNNSTCVGGYPLGPMVLLVSFYRSQIVYAKESGPYGAIIFCNARSLHYFFDKMYWYFYSWLIVTSAIHTGTKSSKMFLKTSQIRKYLKFSKNTN